MSYLPTSFRPFARGGWGGKAASHFRSALSIGGFDMGLPMEDPQVLGKTGWGQIGTVQQRNPGIVINQVLAGFSRDNAGNPLGNCTIELYHGKKMIAGDVSDGAGYFKFLNPGSGPFRIIADKTGFAGVSTETLTAVAYGVDPAFTPLAITPQAWWDPSDLTTLWQDTAGTTAVTADGQAVARIDDKSGNGNHLLQATAGSRPLYKTNGVQSWLLFDGVDDEIITGANATITATHEIACAVQLSSIGSGTSSALFSHSSSATAEADMEMVVYNNVGTYRFRTIYPGLDTFSNGAVLTTDVVVVVTQSKVGATQTNQYTNGTLAQSFATATTAFTTPNRMRIGRHTSSSQFMSGRVYGLVLSPVPSDAQRASLTTWLGAKGGLTL